MAVFDLGLSDSAFWNLTFGQLYKLQDRMMLSVYSKRVDLSAFHASFINANSKGARTRVESLIGHPPILSDEKESAVKGKRILQAFKTIFPGNKGEISPKRKKRKKPAGAVVDGGC